MKNIWDTGDVYIDSCGKHANKVFDVSISQDVYVKIQLLMEKFSRLEWLGYLIGSIDYKNNTAYVEDLVIPKQEISVAKVHDIGSIDQSSIGVIHSHHNMGNCFSNDDKETINKNNDISLLVSHKKITGQIRIKTECGCFYNMDVKVHYDIKHNIDINAFLSDVHDKVKEKVFNNVNNNVNNKALVQSKVNRINSHTRSEVENLFDSRYDDDFLRTYYDNEEENDADFDYEEDEFDYKKVLTYEDLLNSDANFMDQFDDIDFLLNKKGK